MGRKKFQPASEPFRYVCTLGQRHRRNPRRFRSCPMGTDKTWGRRDRWPPYVSAVFFAGNHSDIGGAYAVVESRLSDIALAWMIGEAVCVPDGLKIGPVYVNGS